MTGCDDMADMDVFPDPREPETPQPETPPKVEVCAGRPAATRDDWDYDTDTGGTERLDFTTYECEVLGRLHARGWNGHGVQIVIWDVFSEDGTRNHGDGVADIARYYAPNATFFRIHIDFISDDLPYDSFEFYIRNRSISTRPDPAAADELPVEQSRALRETSTDGFLDELAVISAGNLQTPLPGDDPARATPAMLANGWVQQNAIDGYLHAKSAVLNVGAVDYRPTRTRSGWILSHDDDGHSARAGAARNAFIVAPDDNRGRNFTGTSFAAPRVTGALAILSQKCPTLASEQLAFILLQSARDLGEPGVDQVYGYGLIDLDSAMERAKELAAEYEAFDSTIPATSDS